MLLRRAHPSATELRDLSDRIVDDTKIPDADKQVYEQEPPNGLFYRRSGRLLTSQASGNLVDRVRATYGSRSLFEVQRIGAVERQRSSVETARRINPVHCLASPGAYGYVAMRWMDEEGLHEAIPQNQSGLALSVAVLSWLGTTVLENPFQSDPMGSYDRKIKSNAPEDPALALCTSALSAYQKLQFAQLA